MLLGNQSREATATQWPVHSCEMSDTQVEYCSLCNGGPTQEGYDFLKILGTKDVTPYG